MPDLPPDDLLDPDVWRARTLPAERLEACARDLDGVNDPREAWETLAARGWIPFEAIDDPRRVFACYVPPGVFARWDPITRKVTYNGVPSVGPAPSTIPYAVRLGAMWREVVQTEALAVETHARCSAWSDFLRRPEQPSRMEAPATTHMHWSADLSRLLPPPPKGP